MVRVKVLTRQIWITEEAYRYVKQMAFNKDKPIGQTISDVLLANVKEE
jgi:hypothetical protein